MREILFRGKRVNDGEWITGTPFIAANCCKMIQAVAVHPDFVDEGNVYYSEGYPVDLKTVGQYTGLKDKNGKKIFDGDIVDVGGELYSCYFDECNFEFAISNKKESFGIAYIASPCIEVIGNIHDNPELLK